MKRLLTGKSIQTLTRGSQTLSLRQPPYYFPAQTSLQLRPFSTPIVPDDSEDAAKAGAKQFLQEVKDLLIDEVQSYEEWSPKVMQ